MGKTLRKDPAGRRVRENELRMDRETEKVGPELGWGSKYVTLPDDVEREVSVDLARWLS
jgi:hypothetical protein